MAYISPCYNGSILLLEREITALKICILRLVGQETSLFVQKACLQLVGDLAACRRIPTSLGHLKNWLTFLE